MRPRIVRALVASVLTAAAFLSPTIASAAEDTFALPAATAPRAPFDVAGGENKTALKIRAVEIPPFDFPEPEPVASCRGCKLPSWFEPPPFTL